MKIVKSSLNKESSYEEFEDYFRRNIGKKLSDLNLPVKLKGNVLGIFEDNVLIEINFDADYGWISNKNLAEKYNIPIEIKCFFLEKDEILGLYFLDPIFYEVLPSDYYRFNEISYDSEYEEDEEDDDYPF